MKPAIELEDVGVRLGGAKILSGVTANVPRGGITAVVGLNGCGKTTLLRAILNEVGHTGRIAFAPDLGRIGYVPQRLAFDARMPITVEELFALTLQRRPVFAGVSKASRHRMAELLAEVDAPHLTNKPLQTLSGGELQRVLLALSLEPAPGALVLDEPAAGIDFGYQARFYGTIARLNKARGITILLVSHDLNVVRRHADGVICLAGGKVECAGTPARVLTPETLARTFGLELSAIEPH